MIDKSGYQFHKLATSCLVKKIGLLGLLHMEPQFCESVFLKRSLVFIEKSLTIRSHILHNCNLWGFFFGKYNKLNYSAGVCWHKD